MSEYDNRSGMFLFSLIRVIYPPTLRHSSAQVETTQELQPQTTLESADVYTRHRLWCECWDVSLKVIPGCVHCSIWWMPAGLSEGCMLDLKGFTPRQCALLTSPLLPFSVCAAGSDVETVKGDQRQSCDACWRSLAWISFKYLHYIQSWLYSRQKQLKNKT